MATMSRYCKAYPVTRLREFPGWTLDASQLEKPTEFVNGEEVELERTPSDDDYFFIHDVYVVTDGIFVDEHIVFANVTDEWKQFCTDVLEMKIPDDVLEADPIEPEADLAAAAPAPGAGVDASGAA